MIPRLTQRAAPETLLDASGERFDAARVLQTILRNEKPGGHGDRAAAAGAIELAVWDLNAKLADEPAHVTIARHFGRQRKGEGVNVYAAGGYYYPEESTQRLADEFRAYRELGFDAFKMKIGGATLEAGHGAHRSRVDGRGRRASASQSMPTAASIWTRRSPTRKPSRRMTCAGTKRSAIRSTTT